MSDAAQMLVILFEMRADWGTGKELYHGVHKGFTGERFTRLAMGKECDCYGDDRNAES
jgi:hypothetical protein